MKYMALVQTGCKLVLYTSHQIEPIDEGRKTIGMDQYILLVEDNPDDVALTMRAFQKHKLSNSIVVVRDGEEALDFLFGTGQYEGRNTERPPEVILLDLRLPKIDGMEALRQIRADMRTRLIPVVMLTTSQEQEDLLGSYALGANSYIRKPVDFTAFIESVRQIGLYWLVLNVVPYSR
jgi:two-component system response regulator